MIGILFWTYSTWLAVEFLCVNVAILSAAGAPIGLKDRSLFSDISFDEKFLLHNRTVFCSPFAVIGSKYPNPMYTCSDISVDGVRLYHGYADGARRSECHDCPCGINLGQPNDIHVLCKEMLRAHKITEELIAAYVVKPSCSRAGEAQSRVKFYLDENGLPTWETIMAKNGFINTLQCLTDKPKNPNS